MTTEPYDPRLLEADLRLITNWSRKNSANHLVKESAERLRRLEGYQLVADYDLEMLVHLAHAYALEHEDLIDAEDAQLIEKHMGDQHRGIVDVDCSLGQKYRDAMAAPTVLTPEDEEKVHRLLLPDPKWLRETDD